MFFFTFIRINFSVIHSTIRDSREVTEIGRKSRNSLAERPCEQCNCSSFPQLMGFAQSKDEVGDECDNGYKI